VSINHNFPDDIPLDELEEYRPSITRTIDTELKLPYSVEDVSVTTEFITNVTLNSMQDKIIDCVEYVRGNVEIYNSIMPIDMILADELNGGVLDDIDNRKGLYTNGNRQVIFYTKRIEIFDNGIRKMIITETDMGKLKDVVDVILVDDDLFIVDGGYVLKIGITDYDQSFKTYFGGYGGLSAEYKFRDPAKVIFDHTTGGIYVWDSGNGAVKGYSHSLAHEWTYAVGACGSIDVFGGNLFVVRDGVVEIIAIETSTIDVIIDHPVVSPTGILVDDVQDGFLWVFSGSSITKLSVGGLVLGSHEGIAISDMARDGTHIHILANNLWANALDYAFTQTIAEDFDYTFDWDRLSFSQDEMFSSIVLNDSASKLIQNINDLRTNITSVYVVNKDPSGVVEIVSTEPIIPATASTPCGLYVGYDEIVSCHSLNRMISLFFDTIDGMVSMIVGKDKFNTDDSYFLGKYTLTTSSAIAPSDRAEQRFTLNDTGFSVDPLVEDRRGDYLNAVTFIKSTKSHAHDVLLNTVYLGLYDGNIVQAISLNHFNLNDGEDIARGDPFTFRFNRNSYSSTRLKIDKEYRLRFIASNVVMTFMNVPVMLGDDVLSGNTYTDKGYGKMVKDMSMAIYTSSDTEEEVIQKTKFIPTNWTIGAQSCDGLMPQLFNPSFTPMSLMELNNPILSGHALTSDGCVSPVVTTHDRPIKGDGSDIPYWSPPLSSNNPNLTA